MAGVKVNRCLLVVAVSSLALIAFGSNVSDGIAGVDASTPRATATYHGKNGLIAFTRYRRQDDPIWSEIFVANADGSGARKVSHSSEAVEDDQAHWSPDGAWIVFARCRPAPEVCSIWLARPDGSGQRRVSPACAPHAVPPACADDSNPSFAPDGRHIVFQHEHGHVRSDPLGDAIDRSDIVETDLAGGHPTITIRPDGTGLQQVTHVPSGNYVTSGSYSPDGTSIVFATNLRATPNDRGATAADVFAVRLGSDQLTPVTRTPNLDGWPAWGSHSTG